MSELTWQDPPERPGRLAEVVQELRSRPRTWARIAHEDGLSLFAWYRPLFEDNDFETRVVSQDPNEPRFSIGPRDIYARYIGADREADR